MGLKPIARNDILENIREMKNNSTTPKDCNESQIFAVATKNVVFNFLKNKLKMSEKDRFSLRIQNIFPNRDEDYDTLYLRCKDQSDISLITSHARNIRDSLNDPNNCPSLVPHIPPVIYRRYQECEKTTMAHKITK